MLRLLRQLLAITLIGSINFTYASLNEYKYYNAQPSFNSFGIIGLIQTPSAESIEEGAVFFTFARNNLYKFGTLTVSPFNGFEATYFYYRPYDLYWDFVSSGTAGRYLDKGFSFKYRFFDNEAYSIAFGLDDLGGTGYFAKEYLVSTYKFEDGLRFTAGIGWGAFSQEDSLDNPLELFSDRFASRDYQRKGGGSVNYLSFFRGPIGLFGGFEYVFPFMNGLSAKLEYDPFNYFEFGCCGKAGFVEKGFDLRKKDSNINFGISFPINDSLGLSINFIKGNTLNFTFSFGGNFKNGFFKKDLKTKTLENSNKGSNTKLQFYEDLILNINKNEVYLQSAEITDKQELLVATASSKYRSPIMSHAILGEVASNLNSKYNLDIQDITSIGTNVGTELYRITTPIGYFDDRKFQYIELVDNASNISSGRKDEFRSLEFRPTINYPSSFTGMTPALVNHIGDPKKFYYGGIVIRLDNELQFSRNLMLKTILHQNLTNNFDEKSNRPDSDLPHVRTDIVDYLQQSETYVKRMQLDYITPIRKNLYGKLSGGILEDMYGGLGFELLYKPFNSNASIGIEGYKVRKRSFDRRFDFLDYEINTGHINFNYHIPSLEILGTISYGKYLAGDVGYTFDISRRLPSGFRTGVFFTRTNVSRELFGEGSFDKGFYFQIPLDLFFRSHRGGYINFKLRPLTRDGGQKVEPGNDLIGIIHSSSFDEIRRDWIFFND